MTSSVLKLALIFVCAASPAAYAITINPISYTATPGEGIAEGGAYNYFDDGGTQLTDGILGDNNWTTDLGNGPAAEWVGWKTVNPDLTFNFASPVLITDVVIGFNYNVPGHIFLPLTVIINGISFNLTGNELADVTREFLTFSGNFTGSSLNISFINDTSGLSNFIFIDEVQFLGPTAPIPEPSLMLGMLAFGTGLLYKKRPLL